MFIQGKYTCLGLLVVEVYLKLLLTEYNNMNTKLIYNNNIYMIYIFCRKHTIKLSIVQIYTTWKPVIRHDDTDNR